MDRVRPTKDGLPPQHGGGVATPVASWVVFLIIYFVSCVSDYVLCRQEANGSMQG